MQIALVKPDEMAGALYGSKKVHWLFYTPREH